jgi:hypothetical protein
VLGDWRGYGCDADVFRHFPPDVRWYRGTIEKEELAALRYINDEYWIELSGGTRLAVDAATRIRHGIAAFGVGNGGFWLHAWAITPLRPASHSLLRAIAAIRCHRVRPGYRHRCA